MSLFEVAAKIVLDTSEYEKGLGEASKKTNSFGSSVKSGISKLGSKVKTALKAASAAAVAFGVASVKTGMDFDAAMSKVGAISGATGKDMDALRKKAQEMGAKTQFSATESANAFEYMAMAGWKTGDMLNGIEGIMNLAAASGEDLATTSDIVTDALTAFGLKASDSSHFADLLAVASSNANTNVSMMGETFKYVAPVAGALGISAEDTAEAIGLMANAGIKSSQAGTTLRSIFTRLSTDAGASSKSLGALGILTEKLGVDFYDSQGKVRDFGDILSEAREQWQRISEEDTATFAKKIAGQEGISGWLALMNAAPQDIKKLQQAIENCDGAAEDMANTRLDNLSGDVTILKSTFEGLQIALSDKVSPTLRTFVQEGTKGLANLTTVLKETKPADYLRVFISGFSKAVSKIETVGGDIVLKISSGIEKHAKQVGNDALYLIVHLSDSLRNKAGKLVDTGLKLIMSLADGLIKNIPTLIKTVPTIISNLAGIINDNAPKLVVAGATLIVKLAKGIIDNIPTLVKEFPKIVKAIIDVWTAANWLSLGTKLITGIVNGVKNSGPKIATNLKSLASKAIDAFKSVNWVATGKAVISTLRNAITNAASMILSALKFIGNNGIKAFKSVNWAAVGRAVINLIATAVRGAANLVVTGLRTVATTAMNAFKNLDWKSIGLNVIKGIAAGITGGVSTIANAAKDAAKSALNAAKDFLGIHSPSKVAEKQIGIPYVQGIAKGIRESKDYAKKSAQEVGEAILSASEQNLNNAKVYKEVSLKEEVAYWNAVRKEIKKGTQARIDADKKYYEAVENLRQEKEEQSQSKILYRLDKFITAYKKSLANAQNVAKKLKNLLKEDGETLLSSAEKWLTNQQVYHDTSLKYEVDYWNNVRKQLKKGTQARIDADKKYYEALQTLREAKANAKKEAKTLTSEYLKAYNKVGVEVVEQKKKLEEQLKTDLKKIDDDLEKEIKSLQDNYENTLKNRANAIKGFFGVLDTAEVKTDDSNLLQNVINQVSVLEEWDNTLIALENKLGRDSSLYEELEGMGVDSLDTLRKFNAMSSEELRAYVSFYNKKNEIAETRTRRENQALKAEMQKNIDELVQTAEEQREKLYEEHKKTVNELELNAKEQTDTLTYEYEKALIELAKTTNSQGKDVGRSMVTGISAGIKDAETEMLEVTKKVVEDMVKKAKEIMGEESEAIGSSTASAITVGTTMSLRNGAAVTPTASVYKGDTANSQTNNVVINVYGTEGQSPREIAEETGQVIYNQTIRRGAVFA